MKIMTDDGIGVNPTRENVIAGLNWFVDGVESGDSLFMQFSGQGVPVWMLPLLRNALLSLLPSLARCWAPCDASNGL